MSIPGGLLSGCGCSVPVTMKETAQASVKDGDQFEGLSDITVNHHTPTVLPVHSPIREVESILKVSWEKGKHPPVTPNSTLEELCNAEEQSHSADVVIDEEKDLKGCVDGCADPL